MSCIFSASLSTVSAVSHSISGVIYNDYVRPRKWFAHTDFNANLTMRIIIILMGTICAMSGIIVERFESIFQITMTVAGTFVGATFGTFSLGMLYPWANKKVNQFLFSELLFQRNFVQHFSFLCKKGVLFGIIVSIGTMMAISFSAMHNSSKLNYERLPMSIAGCSNATLAQM